MTSPARDLAVLREVRQRIAEPGAWCQHSVGDPGRPRCLAGWVLEVSNRLSWESTNRWVLDQQGMFRRLFDRTQHQVQLWNDVPSRTHAEVVGLLDRRIAVFEAMAGGARA